MIAEPRGIAKRNSLDRLACDPAASDTASSAHPLALRCRRERNACPKEQIAHTLGEGASDVQ